MLIAGRAVQGLAAAVFPLAFGIIRDEFPPERVSTGIGVISATFGIGGGVGLVVSGVIVDNLHHEWLFWLALPLILVAIVATRLWVPESPVRSPARIDWLGAGLLSGALVTLPLGEPGELVGLGLRPHPRHRLLLRRGRGSPVTSRAMAVDVTKVTELDVEPGALPKTMAAWVIREETQGEPRDAFQLEEIEVPEPGAFEVIVRVMAAGVNYNNVWAALGEPVSVMRYGDHPEYGHHIGGSDASGIVWKVGEGVTRWKPGDEVVIHCNMASYEDPEVHGLDPLAAPSQMIWGYETTWGSFAQFTKVQAQQLLTRPQNLTWDEAASYGLVYFTAYRMLITQCRLQAGQRVLIWGAAGGLGVFATQICAMAGAHAVGVVSSADKGELVKQLGAVDYVDRNEFAGMMRRGGETPDEEKERFKASRAFSKRVKEILGDAPDIVFEHVGKATFPTSVFAVKPFGKVVICAGTTGYDLDFDVRYLWLRQKLIIGSHFANAYECNKANELIESGQIRPVLWRTLGFEGVPEA
ncbi:MAG: crotonyl-CoA carboxylase/reductase, partial [Thermoleophilaceae bacterium]